MNADQPRPSDFSRKADDPTAPVPAKLIYDGDGNVVAIEFLEPVTMLAEFVDVAINNPDTAPRGEL